MKINDKNKSKHINIHNKQSVIFLLKDRLSDAKYLEWNCMLFTKDKMAQNKTTGKKPYIYYQKESQKMQY